MGKSLPSVQWDKDTKLPHLSPFPSPLSHLSASHLFTRSPLLSITHPFSVPFSVSSTLLRCSHTSPLPHMSVPSLASPLLCLTSSHSSTSSFPHHFLSSHFPPHFSPPFPLSSLPNSPLSYLTETHSSLPLSSRLPHLKSPLSTSPLYPCPSPALHTFPQTRHAQHFPPVTKTIQRKEDTQLPEPFARATHTCLRQQLHCSIETLPCGFLWCCLCSCFVRLHNSAPGADSFAKEGRDI